MEQLVKITKNLPVLFFPLFFKISASSKYVNQGQHA